MLSLPTARMPSPSVVVPVCALVPLSVRVPKMPVLLSVPLPENTPEAVQSTLALSVPPPLPKAMALSTVTPPLVTSSVPPSNCSAPLPRASSLPIARVPPLSAMTPE
ncbi:hypothetical protein D9M68_339950 [compost metagenome]